MADFKIPAGGTNGESLRRYAAKVLNGNFLQGAPIRNGLYSSQAAETVVRRIHDQADINSGLRVNGGEA